jgi:hypothetical protein
MYKGCGYVHESKSMKLLLINVKYYNFDKFSKSVSKINIYLLLSWRQLQEHFSLANDIFSLRPWFEVTRKSWNIWILLILGTHV